MFIEVDVQPGANCDYSLTRIFDAVSDPRPVTWLHAPGPRGDVGIYEVTGWSAEGPCPAYAALVENSGEERALLVYGGNEGIRLKPRGSLDPWGFDSGEQWGEPCLPLDTESAMEAAEVDI